MQHPVSSYKGRPTDGSSSLYNERHRHVFRFPITTHLRSAELTVFRVRLLLEKKTSHHAEDHATAQPTLQEHLSAGLNGLRLGGLTFRRGKWRKSGKKPPGRRCVPVGGSGPPEPATKTGIISISLRLRFRDVAKVDVSKLVDRQREIQGNRNSLGKISWRGPHCHTIRSDLGKSTECTE